MVDTIKVPITFEKVDDDLTCVKWTTWFNQSNGEAHGREMEKFQLNHAPLDICYFNVSLVYNYVINSDGSRKYCVELFLSQVNSLVANSNVNSTSSKEGVTTPEHSRQPYAIWSSINGTVITLKKLVHSPEHWKSTKTYVNMANQQPPIFSCFLWIKFKIFGVGEINTLKHLTDLFLHQTYSDVQFCFQEDQTISGHVSILAARSPVFAAMFQHDMQESKTKKVVIEDITPEIFKELLHYIYSGRNSTPLTGDTVQPLFEAADKYDIKDLKEDCVRYLLSRVNVKNAIELMIWADLQSISKLKEVTLECVILNGKEICQQKEWEKLIKNYPDLCLIVTRRMVDIVKFPSLKKSRTD